MTREEYDATIQRVMNNVERLCCDNCEIVIVVSRDVYNSVLNITNEEDTYGTYCGHRIGIVKDPNGGEVENFMKAALIGMTIQNTEVRIGDLLVISEDTDNRLYRMEATDPIQFNDTGLVVEFNRTHRENTYAETDATTTWNTAATAFVNTINVGDLAFMETTTTDTVYTGSWAGTTTTTRDDRTPIVVRAVGMASRLNEAPFSRVDLNRFDYDAPQMSTPTRGRRIEAVKEQERELDPGDTKLLDEFLGSFLKSGA